MFAPKQVGGQDLGQFVIKPFKSWGKVFQKASAHAVKNYHLSSMTRMTEFLARYENPSQSISVIMDSELQRVMDTNQKVLESLIKIILLCGKQGLAATVMIKSVGWKTMKHIPMKATSWNWYDFGPKQIPSLLSTLLSPHEMLVTLPKKIQNELVEVIGECIRNDILADVKRAKFYSVIADEVTDTANKEELSISLRFVLVPSLCRFCGG